MQVTKEQLKIGVIIYYSQLTIDYSPLTIHY
jgi:hypothetical protein